MLNFNIYTRKAQNLFNNNNNDYDDNDDDNNNNNIIIIKLNIFFKIFWIEISRVSIIMKRIRVYILFLWVNMLRNMKFNISHVEQDISLIRIAHSWDIRSWSTRDQQNKQQTLNIQQTIYP